MIVDSGFAGLRSSQASQFLPVKSLQAESASFAVQENGPLRIHSKTRREMIEACGRLCQLLGIARSTGQIYGLLYLSIKPLSLDDMVESLGISKASASTGTRYLAAWGAVRQIWVPGNRRDYFEAVIDLRDLLRSAYDNFFKLRMASSGKRLTAMLENLQKELAHGEISSDDHKICIERLRNLSRLQKKLQSTLPLAKNLL